VLVFDVDSTGSGGLNDWERGHPEVINIITASAGANGTISPTGTITAIKGDTLAFAIAAVSNYEIDQVLVDGANVGALGAFTFTNIQAAHSITASFKLAQQPGDVYTIKNRRDGTFMYDGGDQVKYGASASDDTFKWIVIDLGNNKREFQNVATGDYINNQGSQAWAQCTAKTAGSTSSQWTIQDMADRGTGQAGFYRFFIGSNYLNTENLSGYVQQGSYGDWWSGEWDLIKVSGGNTLRLSKTASAFTNVGGSDSITVTSNVSWTVTGAPAWLTVAPLSGSNNGTLTLTAAANTGADRSGSFTVSGGGINVIVTVTEGSAATTLSLSKTSVAFTNTAGSDSITVTSNSAWTVSGVPAWLTVSPVSGSNNGTLTLTAAANTGADRNGSFTVSAGSISVPVTVTQGSSATKINLALAKTAIASSNESGTYDASKAVDGDATTTRWSSAGSDSQWIMIDLGATYRFSQVVLIWEAAYGKSYQIQTSSNKTTWTDIFSTTTGDGGTDTIDVIATARYVRMNGTLRGTSYGYSLWEFRVMGNPGDIGPTIGTDPVAQTLREGQTATFTVAATGQGSLTYQWYRAEAGSATFAPISSAITASYTTAALNQAGDNGAQFRARVTDSSNQIYSDSAVAVLTVKGLGPDITKQPASQSVMPGQTATFTVEATGIGTLSYQWSRANPGSTTFTPLTGATASSYITPVLAAAADHGASYRVAIKDNSNNYSTTSTVATLSVADDVDIFNEIKVGWNLGNSLDSLGGETGWGNPRITQAQIDAVYAAGFNTIRVPVTWFEQTGPAPSYTINAAYLARVKEVIDYCYKNHMVIDLNQMHEDGWLLIQMSGLDERKAKFVAMWRQIAEYFKDYDQHLIFEGMNEPVLKGGPNQYGGGTQDGWDAINILNQAFVDTVRATGGNNSKRWLMVTSYGANANTGADHMTPPAGKNIMVSIHTYTPWAFCAIYNENYITWDGSMNNLLDNDIQNVKRNFVDKGYHVVFTEFGATFKPYNGGSNEAEVGKWAGYLVRVGKANGVKCIFWDNGGVGIGSNMMGIFDRTNNMNIARPALVKALIDSAK
jgi:endoglucanase